MYIAYEVKLTSLRIFLFLLKQYESDDRPREEVTYRQLKSVERKPELLNGHIPAGHIPKPIVMPDYLA